MPANPRSKSVMSEAMKSYWARRVWATAAIASLLGLGDCSTSKVAVPNLSGPSELALSLYTTASPDLLVADGMSTSALQVLVRDQNGQPKPGQAIGFFTMQDGQFVNIGSLSASS